MAIIDVVSAIWITLYELDFLSSAIAKDLCWLSLLSGALDVIKNRPHLLLNPSLEIDWGNLSQMYPKWITQTGNAITFSNEDIQLIVPTHVKGVLLHPSLQEDELVFIGAQVNSITQSVIPNTIFDDFNHIQEVLNLYKSHLQGEGAQEKKKFSVTGAYEHYTKLRGRPPCLQFRTFQKLAATLPTFEPVLPLIMELCSTSFGGRGIHKVCCPCENHSEQFLPFQLCNILHCPFLLVEGRTSQT